MSRNERLDFSPYNHTAILFALSHVFARQRQLMSRKLEFEPNYVVLPNQSQVASTAESSNVHIAESSQLTLGPRRRPD
jgi:hypothetical protein